ncbi:hypothetical protein GGF37_005980, partial [Kickxella alabastrina]
MDLAGFLANAPLLFSEEATTDDEIEPDITHGSHGGAIRRFGFENGDKLSCIRWDSRFHITSTDIIRALVHRFQDIHRPVVNMKKFEEGVFSDLRSLKPGVAARLEPPRSEFLELLYKQHCVRTQKKQKVFYWELVPHDMLFREALERDLKREAMGARPTTKTAEDVDPKAIVVIGGVELPLSVPPTLAVHPHTAAEMSDGSVATSPALRVSNAQVSLSGHAIPALASASSASSPAFDSAGVAAAAIPASGGLADNNIASSVLSLVSMVSSAHGDDVDGHAVGYPESSSSSGGAGLTDSSDILQFVSHRQSQQQAAAPVSAPAVMLRTDDFDSQQMRQYINQNQSAVGISSQGFSGLEFYGNTGASQPSLSEYISGKAASVASGTESQCGQDPMATTAAAAGDNQAILINSCMSAPMNDSWTGMDFQTLRKKASELRANYNEYQPTPTPHHSPRVGAANGQGLLELLSSDPNALVTVDNIGGFNCLLEQILADAGCIPEGSSAPSSAGVD